jgi:hypothetical protein
MIVTVLEVVPDCPGWACTKEDSLYPLDCTVTLTLPGTKLALVRTVAVISVSVGWPHIEYEATSDPPSALVIVNVGLVPKPVPWI